MKEMLDQIGFDLPLPVTDPTWIFFLVLVIILFAPIILERLRIPHIIGMILAGVAIGEHGFNILVRDSSFELFGKVGLYYIMFLAGLEMNMEDFKSIRVKATVLGLLAFIFPLGIGIWTNLHLLGYGLLTSVLLASMYASHTLIAYPIVIRYGINRQRAVSIAVGGTAVTDTLTLLVLAVIAGMFKGSTSDMFWMWLTESSNFAYDQGGVPVLKSQEYPDTLKAFDGIDLVEDAPAPAELADLATEVQQEAELMLNADQTHVMRVVEAGINGDETLDDIVADWNAAWDAAVDACAPQ
jgi:hypothetical protein